MNSAVGNNWAGGSESFHHPLSASSGRVDNVNGSRGDVDQLSRAKVVPSGLPSVVFEAHGASMDVVIAAAVSGAPPAPERLNACNISRVNSHFVEHAGAPSVHRERLCMKGRLSKVKDMPSSRRRYISTA